MCVLEFSNGDFNMVGRLHVAENAELSIRHPAIVLVKTVVGGGQVPSVWVSSLVRQGFAVLTLEAPRRVNGDRDLRLSNENPYACVADISAAVDLLTTLTFVDGDRVGVLGICAGGGYAVNAAMNDRRIRAVCTVSVLNSGQVFRQGWDGTAGPDASLVFLENASNMRSRYVLGRQVQCSEVHPRCGDINLCSTPNHVRGGLFVPCEQRAEVAGSYPLENLPELIGYDGFRNAEFFLTQPLMVVAGSDASSLWMSEELHDRAATVDKNLLILAGGTHVAVYEDLCFVKKVCFALGDFYRRALAKTGSSRSMGRFAA